MFNDHHRVFFSAFEDQNYELCSAWNNLGVIFHAQGAKAEQDYRSERAEKLYEKAAQCRP